MTARPLASVECCSIIIVLPLAETAGALRRPASQITGRRAPERRHRRAPRRVRAFSAANRARMDPGDRHIAALHVFWRMMRVKWRVGRLLRHLCVQTKPLGASNGGAIAVSGCSHAKHSCSAAQMVGDDKRPSNVRTRGRKGREPYRAAISDARAAISDGRAAISDARALI